MDIKYIYCLISKWKSNSCVSHCLSISNLLRLTPKTSLIMIEGFTAARYSSDSAKSINATVSGQSANPFQELAEFTMAKTKPYGLATSKDGRRRYAIIYLVDKDGKEVELWLNTLTKTVLNPEDKTVISSEYEFNQKFTASVSGKSDTKDWWKAFTDLVGDKTLICHRQSVWVNEKRFIIIGFTLK